MKTNFSFDMQALDEGIHSRFPNHKEAPLIGLTGNFSDGNLTLAPGYYQSIIQAGGVPVVIPPYEDTNLLINTLEQLDGLLLTGGGDLNPLFLHEDPIRELHSINPYRDRQELLLTRLAANRQIPILGICRGCRSSMRHWEAHSIRTSMHRRIPHRLNTARIWNGVSHRTG